MINNVESAEMALTTMFQKDPRVKLESQLAAKRAQLDGNAKRLQDAENRVAACRRKVEESALDDDSKGLDVALANKRAAEDLVGALRAASTKIAAEVSSIEAQIAAEIDRTMRFETSEAVKAVAVRLDDAMGVFADSVADLEASLREASLVVLEAHGPTAYAMNVKQELPPAIVNVLEALRQHCSMVLAGTVAPSLPRAAPEPAKLAIVPAAPMQTVFMMKPSRYRNADGRQVACGAHRVYDLPAPIAKRALEIGAAIAVTDPRRRTFEGQSGMITPDLSRCVALDDSPLTERKSDAPQITSTLFEKVDRGPAYNVAVPRSMIEPVAMGARSMQEDEENGH